jgi:hypothetical protein
VAKPVLPGVEAGQRAGRLERRTEHGFVTVGQLHTDAAERASEVGESEHPAQIGLAGGSLEHFGARVGDRRGGPVHRGSVVDLPADVGHVVDVGGGDHHPMVAIVETQVQRVIIGVGHDLMAKHLARVDTPRVEVGGACPDVGELVDDTHFVPPLMVAYEKPGGRGSPSVCRPQLP